MHGIARNIPSDDWITLILLAVLLLLMLVKKRYRARFLDFCNLPFSNAYFTSQRNSSKVFNFFSFSLFLIHAILISLALYFMLKNFNIHKTDLDFLFFFQLFLAYTVFIGAKYLIEKIVGSVFEVESILDNYIFQKITYKNLLALFLIPFLAILTYFEQPSKSFFIVATIVFVFLNLGLLVRYYVRNRKLVFSAWFYFILYLCTLEIAPYFILYKVFI